MNRICRQSTNIGNLPKILSKETCYQLSPDIIKVINQPVIGKSTPGFPLIGGKGVKG